MAEPSKKKKDASLKIPWQLVAVFLILALGLFAVSHFYFVLQKKLVRECREETLTAMAGMKAAELSKWRREWLAFGNVLSEYRTFIERTEELISNPETAHKDRIREGLVTLQKNYEFERAVLQLPGGKDLLVYPQGSDHGSPPEVVEIGHKAWQSRQVILGDLYREQDTDRLYLSIVIPVLVQRETGKEPIALLTIDINPHTGLFPILEYDRDAASQEILLLRREENEFVILNMTEEEEALFSPVGIPISNFRREKGQTDLGEEGIVTGKDQNDIDVLAFIQAVPDIPWLIMAKEGLEGIYAGMNRQRTLLVIFAAGLIVIAGVILGGFWHLEKAARITREKTKWDQANKNMFEFFQLIIEVMPNPAFFKDTQGRYLGCNAAFEKLLGLNKDKILNKTIRELAPPEVIDSHEKIDSELLDKPGYRIYEASVKAWDGEHHVIFIKATYTHPDGSVGGIMGILKDITQRKRAEEELDQLRKFSDGTVQTMTEGLVLTDSEGKFSFVNPAAASILGFSPGEMVDKDVKSFIAKEHHPLVDEANERRFQGLSDRYELEFIHKDGSPRTLLVSGGPRVQGAQFGGTLAVLTDITERKRMEEEIRSLSLTDELTSLYNRRGFNTLADQQLKIASRLRKRVVLLYMDVDDLKVINDTQGHKQGDLALMDVAEILKKNFRESDIVARMGGDEFTVFAMETAPTISGENLINRLREKLALYNSQSRVEKRFELDLSIGAVLFDPEDPATLKDMLARADTLMYEEKRRKKEARGRTA